MTADPADAVEYHYSFLTGDLACRTGQHIIYMFLQWDNEMSWNIFKV